jgi:peptidoglycan-associated lipoprotein
MKTKRLAWLAMIAAALLFAGCSSTGTRDEGANNANGGADVVEGGSGSGAQTSGARQGGAAAGNPLEDPNSPLSVRKIYFDFDKSTIRAEFYDTLRAHAAYLVAHPSTNLTIEGHCDERGSREYNIGLGERRANAVKQFLVAEGVNAAQINTISYGEERPEALGHNEAAWAKNRRAVLVY